MNDAYIIKAADKQFLYAVGNITNDFPFLAETDSGKIVTPFYLDNGDKIGMVSGKPVTYQSSKKESCEVPEVEHILKNLKVPTIAVNIPDDRYKKVCTYSKEFESLYKQKKDGGNTTVFVPIVAFDEDAIRLFKEVSKGDTISIFGELKPTLIKSVGWKKPTVWAQDVRKVRTAKRNLTGAVVE